MSELTKKDSDLIASLVINGDLSKLSQDEKVRYYKGVCDRVGLDPLAQPFKLLKLNGKEVMYCDRSGAQQLNKLHNVSHQITSRELIEAAGVYQVTARASIPNGRYEESIGAVNVTGLKGEQYANAIMKAETKAKRRSTLDLLGLGMLDESEVETIQGAQIEEANVIEEKATDVQLLYIEELLRNTSINQKRIEAIEQEYEGYSISRAEKCIAYLKENQIERNLNNEFDKRMEREHD